MSGTNLKSVETLQKKKGSRLGSEEMVQERFYSVRQLESLNKIHNKEQAYNNFLKNWDKEVMTWVKEFKTLVLDSADTAIYIVSFEAFGKIDTSHVTKLFEIIKGLPNAYKIIVGQNNPEKSVLPDREDQLLAMQFQRCGKVNDIEVVQQLIISSNSLYAFDKNKLDVY